MLPVEESNFRVLVPYDPREAMTLAQAAERAERSVETIKTWCKQYGVGRKIGGQWVVSKPALEMFLDGDVVTLRAYHAGQMTDEVRQYFIRVGVSPRRVIG